MGREGEEQEEKDEWVKGSMWNQMFSPARAKEANPDSYLESSRGMGREGREQPKTQFSIREKWTLRCLNLPLCEMRMEESPS